MCRPQCDRKDFAMPLIKLHEAPDIYNIKIPLPKNALRDLNVYVIVSEGEALVIDTGFRMEDCRVPLLEGLQELGIPMEKLSLFITHMHSDHAGQIDLFTPYGCKVYMNTEDIERLKQTLSGAARERLNALYLRHGFPEKELAEANLRNPIYAYAPSSAEMMIGVEDGQELSIGSEKLRCLKTPGHTPGHTCLYMEKDQILFAGDHILYDITPNITTWSGMEDSLGAYMDSIKRTLSLPIAIAYPAHRELHSNHYERMRQILHHHEERLNEVLSIVRKDPGCSAWEATSRMKWSIHGTGWHDYPVAQKWFAVGECMAHLEWLRLRGFVEYREQNDRLYLYPTEVKAMVEIGW